LAGLVCCCVIPHFVLVSSNIYNEVTRSTW
jgi:hypothetical protein